MHKVEIILRWIDSTNLWIGKTVSMLILVITGVICYEVFVRYFLHSPTQWAHEISAYTFGVFFMLGGGYTLLLREHVTMDILYSRFSPKGKAILDIVTSLLFFLFISIMIWKGWQQAMLSIGRNEHSTTFWAPPVYPFRTIVPIAAFLVFLQGLAKLIRDFDTAITGREHPAPIGRIAV